LYFLVKSDYIQNIIKINAKGTTILHAGSSIEHMDFILANKDIMDKFNNIVGKMLLKIIQTKIENKKLRDISLPKLMSGEMMFLMLSLIIYSNIQQF
jgi:type I restriction enzyme S subunit